MALPNELAIALLYSVPLSLLALLFARETYRPRWLLITALTLLPFFYISHYYLLDRLQGWPSDAELPDEFKLVAYEVVEPDKPTNTAGQILLWIRSKDGDEPRVHRLAYGKALHQELLSAGERQFEGKQQVGRRSPVTSTDQNQRNGDQISSVRFRDEEPPALPHKGDE